MLRTLAKTHLKKKTKNNTYRVKDIRIISCTRLTARVGKKHMVSAFNMRWLAHTYRYISHHRSLHRQCTQTETLPGTGRTCAVPSQALQGNVKNIVNISLIVLKRDFTI